MTSSEKIVNDILLNLTRIKILFSNLVCVFKEWGFGVLGIDVTEPRST
jgi:hypothetical protein